MLPCNTLNQKSEVLIKLKTSKYTWSSKNEINKIALIRKNEEIEGPVAKRAW